MDNRELKPETLTDRQLIALLNETASIARSAYRTKKLLQAEQYRRFVPDTAETLDDIDYPHEEPGGLTTKQISLIRKWAKTPHTTDDLIIFITGLLQKEHAND